jgi:hypothetical protein
MCVCKNVRMLAHTLAQLVRLTGHQWTLVLAHGRGCWCARQAEVMRGRSIDNAPWPCVDLGDALKEDLASCIDWHWLQASRLLPQELVSP